MGRWKTVVWLLFLLAVDLRIVYEYRDLEWVIWSIVLFPVTMVSVPILVLAEESTNILPALMTFGTVGWWIYSYFFERRQQAKRDIEFTREMLRNDTRIVPLHLLDSTTKKQIEAEQRKLWHYGDYEQMRADFKEIGPYIHRAWALEFASLGSDWEQKRKYQREFSQLMTQTIRPKLERLRVPLPDDESSDMYWRLEQLSHFAQEGRLELAQQEMRSEESTEK